MMKKQETVSSEGLYDHVRNNLTLTHEGTSWLRSVWGEKGERGREGKMRMAED